MIVPRRLGRACFTLGSRVWAQLREGPALFLVVTLAVGVPTFFGSRALAERPAADAAPRVSTATARPAVVHDIVPPPTVAATPPKAAATTPAPLLGKGLTPSPRPGQPGLRAPSRKGQKAR